MTMAVLVAAVVVAFASVRAGDFAGTDKGRATFLEK
jgi:ABC-type cobalt transport system substrate-binding protein